MMGGHHDDRRGVLRRSPFEQLPESSTLPSPRCGLCERQRKSEMVFVEESAYRMYVCTYMYPCTLPADAPGEACCRRSSSHAGATSPTAGERGVGRVVCFCFCLLHVGPRCMRRPACRVGTARQAHPRPSGIRTSPFLFRSHHRTHALTHAPSTHLRATSFLEIHRS